MDKKYSYHTIKISADIASKMKAVMKSKNPLIMDLDEYLAELKQKKKEEPMNTTTKKIPHAELGNAKKQRDVLRARWEADVFKFIEKFGGDRFEVAHAIADSVLMKMDNHAKNYGSASMPNNLAQTLLPGTQALIDGATPAPAVAMKQVKSIFDKFSWEDTEPGLSVTLPTAATLPKPVPTLKKDVDVTEADITAAVIWTGKNFTNANKYVKQCYEVNGGWIDFISGKGYIWGDALKKYLPSCSGYTTFVIRVMKKSPYFHEDMVTGLKLKAPVGFKFRKLKNKPIYKLVPVKSYPNGVGEKSPVNSLHTETFPPTAIYHTHLNSAIEAAVKGKAPTNLTVSCLGGNTATLLVGGTYNGYFVKNVMSLPEDYVWLKNNMADSATLLYLPVETVLPVEVADQIIPTDGTHWETYYSNDKNAILMWGSEPSKNPAVAFPPKWYVEKVAAGDDTEPAFIP